MTYAREMKNRLEWTPKKRMDEIFVANVAARERAAGFLRQNCGAAWVVAKIGDDLVIGFGKGRDEGASQNSGGARHQNARFFSHFCGARSLAPTLKKMIWFNGILLENGALDATSAGVTLGWGVFTTLAIQNGAPTFLRRHFERLQRDAHAAEIDFWFDFETVARGLDAVLSAQNIANGLARLTLTQRGDGRWNQQSGADLSIVALETAPQNQPLRVGLSPWRVEAKRPLADVKTTAYLPYFWAWREANKRGFDEAILRNGNDFVCEGARSSLFWIQNETLWTPALETGCLRGIGRDLVLEWAKSRQIPLNQGEFEISQIEMAEEIWLVSAASGARAVTSWHDENGAEIWQSSGAHRWRDELMKWWQMEGKS